MSRDWRLYLADIVARADRVLGYTRGMTFAQFAADEQAQDAVVLNLIVVGEAAKRVPAAARDRAPGVPWQDVARTRDRLVHGYDTISLAKVWEVLTDDLPPLRGAVAVLLAELDAESPPPAE